MCMEELSVPLKPRLARQRFHFAVLDTLRLKKGIDHQLSTGYLNN